MRKTTAESADAGRAETAQRHSILRFGLELRELLALAGPIVISQLGQIGMTTADTVMVGPLGPLPLAAAGIGFAIFSFLTTLCVGVLLGMVPLVSQAWGAGRVERCREVLVQGLWLSCALSVPVMIACWGGTTLARWLGQDAAVAALAGDYLDAVVWGVPPLLLFFAVREFLEGRSIVAPVTVITLAGLGVNIAANRVFIYGVEGWLPPLGLVGAGWATTVVRWTMFFGLIAYLIRRADLHPLRGVSWKPARALFTRIAAVGAPVGTQIGLEVGIFATASVAMGWLGPVELAAHQVTINIAATTFMVALGVSLAGSVRVGQHLGAARRRAMARAALGTYTLAVAFMAVCAALFLVIPETLIGLYSPDPEIQRIGTRLLFVAALFQIFDGAQAAGVGVLRGAADTRTPMIVAGIGYWLVGAPVGYLLAFHVELGAVGVWAGLSVGLAVVALLLARRVQRLATTGEVGERTALREPVVAGDAGAAS